MNGMKWTNTYCWEISICTKRQRELSTIWSSNNKIVYAWSILTKVRWPIIILARPGSKIPGFLRLIDTDRLKKENQFSPPPTKIPEFLAKRDSNQRCDKPEYAYSIIKPSNIFFVNELYSEKRSCNSSFSREITNENN